MPGQPALSTGPGSLLPFVRPACRPALMPLTPYLGRARGGFSTAGPTETPQDSSMLSLCFSFPGNQLTFENGSFFFAPLAPPFRNFLRFPHPSLVVPSFSWAPSLLSPQCVFGFCTPAASPASWLQSSWLLLFLGSLRPSSGSLSGVQYLDL